jgi:hypothetical protein
MTTFYGDFPILLPGTTESVSRNGLKKITGTILFKPGQENEARDLAEQNGSVFPEPAVATTDMGLLEMAFDAYRDSGVRSRSLSNEIITLSKSFQQTITFDAPPVPDAETPPPKEFNWTIAETYMVDSWIGHSVVSAGTPSSQISAFNNGQTISTTPKFLKRQITGKKTVDGAESLSISWLPEITSVSRRNFGELDEADVVVSMVPRVV